MDRAEGQHPAARDVPDQFQIGVGGREHVGCPIGRALALQQPDRGFFHGGDAFGEDLDRPSGIVARQYRQRRLHVGDQVVGRLAAVLGQLAADQIHGLDAVGALIDRGDAGVAIVLGRAGLLDEAHAAVDLDPHGGDLAADIRRPGLGDGGEQVLAALPAAAVFLGRRVLRQIGGDAGGQADGAGGGDLRLHHGQHATHVRMVDDRGVGLAGPGRAALPPVAGIGEGMLVGPLGNADALDADGEAGGVHHHEHMGQALVGLADQFGGRALIGHDAGGGGVDAQLVLDPDGTETVARAQRAVVVQQEFGGEEEADPLGSRGRVGQAGQDHVDDVVGGVVVAPGDEDLLAVQRIRPVAVRRGRGGQGAEVRSRTRLGQHHGPGPFAADQFRQIDVLLRRRAVGLQRLDRGQRQHWAQAEGHVGGVHRLIGRQFQRLGQVLAAGVGGGGQAGPAALGELAIGVGEARRGGHHAVGPGRTLQVADPVQRGQHAFGELRRRLEHRAHQVDVIVRKGAGGRDLVDARHGLQGEGEITDGGAVGHGGQALRSEYAPFMPPCRDGMQAALASAFGWSSLRMQHAEDPWPNRATAILSSR